jgi:Ser/Thr protein kinase RdoA (MazF antagonist)
MPLCSYHCVMFGGKKSLPAQSSVLAPGPLMQAARAHYPIERGASCVLRRRSVHDTYVVSGADEQFALRVYRHGHRGQDEIQWELSLVEHLAAQGAAVAPPLRTQAGNRFAIVLAPEGPRPVALFRYAPGQVCRGDQMTAVHARAYGRALAGTHLRMETFETRYDRFELDLDHLLLRPIHVLAPHMREREHDLTYLRRLADDVREAVLDFDDRGLSRGLCHGNATGANAHLDQRGEFTLFDFDAAGFGWRSYDVATFRWAMLRSHGRLKADEAFSAFLEGYREVRGFPKVDEEAVPPFVAAHQIWYMGEQAALTAEMGTSLMDDAYFDDAINFLHDWYKEMMAYS